MYDNNFKKASGHLMSYCKEHLGYKNDPSVEFVSDKNNSKSILARTAHYEPANRSITVYISNRHPKDALRSLAHELVHHAQNMRGDLKNVQTPEGYAQSDSHMRSMEEEAYLKGNMLFRDWEDSLKSQTNSTLSIGEQKMKDKLNNLVIEKVIEQLQKENVEVDEGLLDRIRAGAAGLGAGVKARAGNIGKLAKGAAAAAGGDQGALTKAGEDVVDPAAKSKAAKLSVKGSAAYKQIGKISKSLVGDIKSLGLEDVPELRRAVGQLASAQKAIASLVSPEMIMKFAAKKTKDLSEEAKPDFPDVDGDGDTKEPISKAQKDKKEKEGKSGKKPAGKPKKGEIPPQLRKHVKAKQDKKGDEEKVEEGDDPLKYVDPEDIGPQTDEEKAEAIKKQGMRHGRQGVKPHKYYDPDVQAAYMKAYKQGKAMGRLPYSEGQEETYFEEIGPRGGSEVSIDPEKGLKIAEIDQHIQRKLSGIKDLTQLMAQRDAMAGEQMYSRFNEALSDILAMQLEEQEELEETQEPEVQEESETAVNPLSEVKKSQNSINSLKNIKLQRINEALMSRLIK